MSHFNERDLNIFARSFRNGVQVVPTILLYKPVSKPRMKN